MPKPGKRKRKKKYQDYLASPYWKRVAATVIDRDRCCTKCGATKQLEVHHLTYAHRGQEHAHLTDLTVLCSSCHGAVHGKKSTKKRA